MGYTIRCFAAYSHGICGFWEVENHHPRVADHISSLLVRTYAVSSAENKLQKLRPASGSARLEARPCRSHVGIERHRPWLRPTETSFVTSATYYYSSKLCLLCGRENKERLLLAGRDIYTGKCSEGYFAGWGICSEALSKQARCGGHYCTYQTLPTRFSSNWLAIGETLRLCDSKVEEHTWMLKC